jgi:cyclophilin family peptidyl-prolyl cis-trans isomerase
MTTHNVKTNSRRSAFGWSLLMLLMAGCETSAPPQSTPLPTAPSLGGPTSAAADAPETFRVKFTTTKGDVVVAVYRDWSPNGADHFRELVEADYYDGCKFFRVVEGFMAQFGISGDPAMNAKWGEKTIPDDPVVQSNQRGFVTYAKTGLPNSRSTQLFINFGDNSFLDPQGFSPFGQVVEGMDVVDSFNKQYGEATTELQGEIRDQGNAFLDERFPGLDGIITAKIIKSDAAAEGGTSKPE